MSWRFPYPFTAYTKSGTTYTKAGTGLCSCDLLGASRVKGLAGNLTSADTLVCSAVNNAAYFKKDGRIVVNKAGTYIVVEIVYPDNIRGRHIEVYSRYNGTAKVNEATGELA